MKNGGEGEGGGGVNREGGLIDFPPLKMGGGGLIREGKLNRRFMVCYLLICQFINAHV